MRLKNGKGALRCRAFFLWRIVDGYDTMVTGIMCPLVQYREEKEWI